MHIKIDIAKENFDLTSILQEFEHKETNLTGSIVIHRGKVKLPGKKVVNLSLVLLEKRTKGDIQRELYKVGERAGKLFHLQQIYINYRVGRAKPGDDILLVIVSATDRMNAFSAAKWIVDEIKKEEIITLTEMEDQPED